MTARYCDIESPSAHNNYAFAQQSIERSSVTKVVNGLVSIVLNTVTIISIITIIKGLNVAVFFLIFWVVVINSIIDAKTKKLSFERQKNDTVLNRILHYTIWWLTDPKFAKEMRIFNLVKFLEKKYNTDRNRMYNMLLGYAKDTAKINLWPTVIFATQHFIVYGYITYKLFLGDISIGEFSMYISSIFLFSSKLNNCVGQFITIFDENKYIVSFVDFMKNSNISCKELINDLDINSGLVIKFVNVSFRYEGRSEYALKNINLTITSPERISIVGENGSGKTTFIKLLLGLYKPESGNIYINGIDIESINRIELMKLFAPVFQDFCVLNYTIKENIVFEKDEDDDNLFEILKKIGLEEKVSSLNNKLDTYITHNFDQQGIELSGGEAQKLAIARALYKNAPIYVFDEPTAALSPSSEYEIYKRFGEITENKTTIFISHRLASCRFCDKIFVFSRGRIIEEGTHDELMSFGGQYYTMFSTQAQYYNIAEETEE